MSWRLPWPSSRSGCRRRRRLPWIGGGAGGGEVAAGVAGRVRSPYPVEISGRGGERGVAVAGRGRGSDQRKARAAAPRAALDEISRHPDVVGRGRPRQINLAARDRRRGKPTRDGRRAGGGGAARPV